MHAGLSALVSDGRLRNAVTERRARSPSCRARCSGWATARSSASSSSFPEQFRLRRNSPHFDEIEQSLKPESPDYLPERCESRISTGLTLCSAGLLTIDRVSLLAAERRPAWSARVSALSFVRLSDSLDREPANSAFAFGRGGDVEQALGSRYVIGERLGGGGMGTVYRATRRDGGPDRAVKLLRPELAEDPVVLTRFVQERTLMLKMRNEHLVAVEDMIVDGDTVAIVMELVGGGTLRRHAQRQRADGGSDRAAADPAGARRPGRRARQRRRAS